MKTPLDMTDELTALWSTEYFATSSTDGKWWLNAGDNSFGANTPDEILKWAFARLGACRICFRNSRNEVIDEYEIDKLGRTARIKKCRHCRRQLQRGGHDYSIP